MSGPLILTAAIDIGAILVGSAANKKNGSNRVEQVSIMSSAEGTAINRIYGTIRASSQLIWATKFKEYDKKSSSGGKGGPKSTTQSFTVSVAVAFCEGSARTTLGRVWADGKLIDLSKFTYRFYPGSETQMPDSLIESIEGSANVSAYRGTAYVVFENMDLTDFGNRIPQITAEVTRPVESADAAHNLIQGVNLIPATGSFAYATDPYLREINPIETDAENVNNSAGQADILESLDQLDAALPNCDTVSVVVAWFGNDLRCASTTIKPRIGLADADRATATWLPNNWSVAGLGAADVVSTSIVSGSNAYGSTPSDDSILACIAELKSRGKRIVFNPIILMDIPAGNALPDPYGGSEQAAFPWRGRITCNPAPGHTSTVDKTATAGTQVGTFFTSTWGYNNFITHYANLCATAGGVDAFLIGSELIGLTSVRAASNVFTAVNSLKTLAAAVAAILPASSLGYAADWSEYHSYRPTDGTNDVYFNLDPLWTDTNIDFIGIDNYLPITDWRQTTTQSIYDIAYLKGGIEAGEYYDWYYASDADRTAGTRTTITDGAYSKPWVFRNKDIRNWWRNVHYNRPAGTEAGSSTAWAAGAKPVWFTEFGCPAVNAGTNEPNVFYDPKSSESALPHFSTGTRDDLIQARYLQAMLEYWTDNGGIKSGGGVETAYADLLTALGASTGDTVGMTSFSSEKSAYSYVKTNYPARYGVTLTGSDQGEFLITLVRSGTPFPAPAGEAAAMGNTLAGDLLLVEFDADPGNHYEVFVRSIAQFYRIDYTGVSVVVFTLYADLVGTAESGTDLGTMVDPANMLVYTWDARPFPAFPYSGVWGDGGNYQTGHWINGRVGVSTSVANLISEICGRTMDSSLVDTSLVVGSGLDVSGYYISQTSAPKDDLAPVMSLFSIDAHESEGKIKFVQRSLATTITLDIDDLVPTSDMPIGYKITRTQSFELPGSYSLTYVNASNDYQNAAVSGMIEGGDQNTIATANYPMVLTDSVAKAVAETLVHDAWISQESIQLTVPPSLSRIEPGDIVKIGIKNLGFRIQQTNNAGAISLQGNGCDPAIFSLTFGSSIDNGLDGGISIFGADLVEFMDIPLITGTEDQPQAPRLAAAAIPWPGAAAIYKANASGGYDLNVAVSTQSVIGELTVALPAGPKFVWDTGNSIHLEFYTDDTLSSAAALDVSAGTNIIAIQSPSGLWEMIGFTTATLISARHYTLTGLLRGRYGTEDEMVNAPYPIGSRVVVIGEALLGTLGMTADQRNISYTYRYGPAVFAQDDVRYRSTTYAGQCVGLRPYAPVHVQVIRNHTTLDMAISWDRRTRFNGDSLDDPAPLNEETEAYSIDIYNGSSVIRTLTATTPSVAYTSAQEITDFGGHQTSLHVVVYQLSATIGRGAPADGVINVQTY